MGLQKEAEVNWGPAASLAADLTWEKLSVALHPEQKQKELGSAAQAAGYSSCVLFFLGVTSHHRLLSDAICP